MATISSLGIGSGLLTSELLESLLEAERAPVERRLDYQQEVVEARLSAWGELSSALSGFQSAARGLNSGAVFNTSQALSSNDSALSATAGNTAGQGQYSVHIQQLAQQHTLASQTFSSVDDVVGSGTLTFRFGTTGFDGSNYDSFNPNAALSSRSLTLGSHNNTLAGVRDAINAADMGVQATIVDDGSGYRLLFTSEQSGAAASLEVTASGSGALTSFNYHQGDQSLIQTQQAQDAEFSVNGLSVSRDSNLVAGVIPGVTLNLKAVTSGPVTLSVSKDPEPLVERIHAFVDSYNQLKTLSDMLSAYKSGDGDEEGQASLLTGDAGLRRLMSELDATLRAVTAGDTFRSLAEIGIRTNQHNNYQLEFHRQDFDEALAQNAQAVTSLFTVTGRSTDSQVEFLQGGNQTQPGSYRLEITRMAQAGRYIGDSVAGLVDGNIGIDAGNNSFSLLLNGVQVSVELTEGQYATAALLAGELQRQINNHEELRDLEHSIQVSFDADQQRFELTSNRYGSDSVVQIAASSPAVAALLGLTQGQGAEPGESRGVDVAGLINGVEARGSGQFLTAAPVNVPARAGVYQHTVHGDLSQLDAGDTFRIEVDGVLSGPVSLGTPTDTSPQGIAAAMQGAINNSAQFIAAGVSVQVHYDSDAASFKIRSESSGASSSVRMLDLQGDAAALFGFTLGRGAQGAVGADASGAIDPAAGLRLRISGGSVGQRGVVEFGRGVADRLNSLVDNMLGANGILSSRQEALNNELAAIAEKRTALIERMARSERRLQSSFLANDLIIARFNSTGDFLTSQLQMLEALATPQKKK